MKKYKKEECPSCAGKNAYWGFGATDNPKDDFEPYKNCKNCNGTGFLTPIDPNDILKEML